MRKISEIINIYHDNKSANVSDTCTCPICGKTFIKKHIKMALCGKKCKREYREMWEIHIL